MQKVGIIGGGPAGLAAARALYDASVAFELFEDGPPLQARRHDCADELGVGTGGAGLFSDGKFSFYPSGTHLYALADPARLRTSYDTITDLLDRAGIETAPYPAQETGEAVAADFQSKDYYSSYGTLPQRLSLIDDLSAPFADHIHNFNRVESVARSENGFELHCLDRADGRVTAHRFTALIIASGRFGAMAFEQLFDEEMPLSEQRYEVGIRIEHPDGVGFLRHSKNPDVKFIMREAEVEVRTFCTCRRGEVWLIPYEPMAALSGRSDGPPSNYCNFGLLPRFASEKTGEGREIWAHFRQAFPSPDAAIWQPLPEFLDGPNGAADGTTLDDRPWHPRDRFERGDIAAALHPTLTDVLKGSIRAIVERYPDMYSPESVCLFPAVEGVGHFPAVDADLRIAGDNIWCCGDVVGRFRGLIPAMVSGHYAGESAATWIGAATIEATHTRADAPA